MITVAYRILRDGGGSNLLIGQTASFSFRRPKSSRRLPFTILKQAAQCSIDGINSGPVFTFREADPVYWALWFLTYGSLGLPVSKYWCIQGSNGKNDKTKVYTHLASSHITCRNLHSCTVAFEWLRDLWPLSGRIFLVDDTAEHDRRLLSMQVYGAGSNRSLNSAPLNSVRFVRQAELSWADWSSAVRNTGHESDLHL